MTRRARRGAGPRRDPKKSSRDTAASPRRAWLTVVLVAATVVRAVNLWWMVDHPVTRFQTAWSESDTAVHWEWAGRIRDGDVLGRDTVHAETTWMREIAPIEEWHRWLGGDRVFAKAPLYPYVLAGLRLVARDRLGGVLFGQMLIGIAGVALTFMLAERFFGLTAATVAGLCAAFYGPSLLHETLLVRDCLAATLSLLLLWLLTRPAAAGRGRWLGAGVAFGLAVLARELTMLFGPLVVIWIVQRSRDEPAAMRRALATFAVGACIGVLPLAARNLAVGVEPWRMSALGGQGVILGHAPETVPAGFMVPDSAKAIFLGAQGDLGATLRLTLAAYDGDWLRFLYNEAARAAAILASFEAGDNASWYYFTNRWPLLRFSLRYEMILALGLVGAWVVHDRTRGDARILVYFLLAAFVGLQYTAVVSRYRLVPAAVLMVYAGGAVAWVVETLREGRWSTAARGVAAVAAVLLVSTSLLPDFGTRHRHRPTEFIIASRAYMERGEPERAYDEMRAGLLSAYAGPDQHVLPGGYLPLVTGLLRVARTIGRTTDAVLVMEQLRRTYDADPTLATFRWSTDSSR